MKKFYIVLLSFFLLAANIFGQTVIYEENFDGKTWPLTDWFEVWGSGATIGGGGYFETKNGLYYSAKTDLDWSTADKVKIQLRFQNTGVNHKAIINDLTIRLVEDIDAWGNIQGQTMNVATVQSEDEWQNYIFTISQSDWSGSSLRLELAFSSTNNQARAFLDDIQITTIQATAPPVASFSSNVRYITEGGLVNFFDMSSEAPTNYNWSLSPSSGFTFAPGSSASSESPVVQFSTAGFYSVTLDVENDFGSSSTTIESYIIVNCPAVSDDHFNGYISNVSFGSFSNPSVATSYSNFSQLKPEMLTDDAFDIVVDAKQVKWTGTWNEPIYMSVWFDWDQNGVFNETRINLNITGNNKSWTGTKTGVTVPVDFQPGLVGVRVKLANSLAGVQDACGNVERGEVEDYLINFTKGAVSEDLGNQINLYGATAETSNAFLTNPAEFSIEGWVKASYSGGVTGIFGQTDEVMMIIDNGNLVFRTENGDQVATSWVYNGKWTHIAGVADATGLSLYVNGHNIGSSPLTSSYFANPYSLFAIAGNVVTGGNTFVGSLDEVRVWSDARTAGEIQDNMYKTVPSTSSNLIGYFQFNEGDLGTELKNWIDQNHAVLSNISSEVLVRSSAPYKWTGLVGDQNFNTVGNWSWGAFESPYISNSAIIPENSVVFVNDYASKVGSLDLRPGANFTIAQDASLTVTDSIILKSTIENVASLLDAGELIYPADHAKIELPLIGSQWYRLGQPFASPTGDMYKAGDPTSWVYRSTTNWQRITDVANAIAPMEGIMVLYNNDVTLNSTGSLNTGAMSWTISYGRGYYLFSNPYPSAIDWTPRWPGETNDTGVALSDNVDQTIYYRVYAGAIVGDYNITYNGFTGVPTLPPGDVLPGGYTVENIGKISPLQSVWVKINDGNPATIELDNRARTMEDSPSLKSASSENHQNIIRIMQANEYISDVAVLYFSDRYVDGIDREDSEKMFNSSLNVPEIYTRVGSKSLAINGLPALAGESYAFPVSVRNRVAGEVKLSVNLEEFTPNFDLVLEDKVAGEWINMQIVDGYTYTPKQMGDVHDRFVLHLNRVQQVPTTIDENGIQEIVTGITIIGKDKSVRVKINADLLNSGEANIEVLDTNGRLVNSKQTTSSETEIALPSASGMYIIKVKADGRQKTEKVLKK
jgi:hypothetical protein